MPFEAAAYQHISDLLSVDFEGADPQLAPMTQELRDFTAMQLRETGHVHLTPDDFDVAGPPPIVLNEAQGFLLGAGHAFRATARALWILAERQSFEGDNIAMSADSAATLPSASLDALTDSLARTYAEPGRSRQERLSGMHTVLREVGRRLSRAQEPGELGKLQAVMYWGHALHDRMATHRLRPSKLALAIDKLQESAEASTVKPDVTAIREHESRRGLRLFHPKSSGSVGQKTLS